MGEEEYGSYPFAPPTPATEAPRTPANANTGGKNNAKKTGLPAANAKRGGKTNARRNFVIGSSRATRLETAAAPRPGPAGRAAANKGAANKGAANKGAANKGAAS